MKDESFSIIIPTFNRAKNLKNLLNKISKINYNKNLIEVIIIDDASSDNTRAITKSFTQKLKIYYIRKLKNSGPSESRNLGLKKTNKNYIIFIDDDCSPEKNWLKKINFCLNKESVLGTYGKVKGIEKNFFSKYGARCYFNKAWEKFTMNNICFKSEIIKNLNFKNDVRSYEDVDFVERAEKLIKLKKGLFVINDSIVYHRAPDSLKEIINTSKRAGKWFFSHKPLLKQSLIKHILIIIMPILLILSALIPFPKMFLITIAIYSILLIYLVIRYKCYSDFYDFLFLPLITYLVSVGFILGLLENLLEKKFKNETNN